MKMRHFHTKPIRNRIGREGYRDFSCPLPASLLPVIRHGNTFFIVHQDCIIGVMKAFYLLICNRVSNGLFLTKKNIKKQHHRKANTSQVLVMSDKITIADNKRT